MLLRLANPPGAYGTGRPRLLNLPSGKFFSGEAAANGVPMTDDADRAASALIAAFRTLADSLPGMREKQAARV